MAVSRTARNRGPQGTRFIFDEEPEPSPVRHHPGSIPDSGKTPSKARLGVLNHSGEIIASTLIPARRILIGRDAGCQIRLRSPTVSSMHASITRKKDRWWILNYMSSNGTYVNRRKVTEAALAPGDRIRLGEVTLVFDYPERTDGVLRRFWRRLTG